jgi:hypothetical protein
MKPEAPLTMTWRFSRFMGFQCFHGRQLFGQLAQFEFGVGGPVSALMLIDAELVVAGEGVEELGEGEVGIELLQRGRFAEEESDIDPVGEPGFFLESGGPTGGVEGDEAEGGMVGVDGQGGVEAELAMAPGEGVEVDVREGVAVTDEGGALEKAAGMAEAVGDAGLAGVHGLDAGMAEVKVGGELVEEFGFVTGAEDEICQALLVELADEVFEERAAVDREERFGGGIGQGPKALTATAAEDDGGGDRGGGVICPVKAHG